MVSRMFLIVLGAAVLATFTEANDGPDCHIKYQQFANHSMCLDKSPNAWRLPMTDQLRQHIVDSHNWRRTQVSPQASNMMKMRWSHELEVMAQRWAEACEFRGGLVHDEQRFIPGGMFVGQSMAGYTLNFDVAIDFWWSEVMKYKIGRGYMEQLKNSSCGFMVGHYTQMTWANTYMVGCAAATCNETEPVIVCNYGPAGNVVPFTKPYDVGPKCSKCKTCTDNGLCDCGDLDCHGGVIDPSTCTCDCTISADGIVPNFMRKSDCTLYCSEGVDFKYCGDEVFNDCSDAWTAKKCPHMCNVCPYAEDGYVAS